jgi:aspartate-semialdehyde dehydrogenase
MNIAIIGATGAVGQEFIKLIQERNFKYNNIILAASKKSVNKLITINNTKYKVVELNKLIFNNNIDLAFFFVSSELSLEYIEYAKTKNIICIDNSSAFRNNKPLIIPEINMLEKKELIIANPNCSTIILCMLLYPLTKLSVIKRVVVSTYQSVSGAGYNGLNELSDQINNYNKKNKLKNKYFNSQCLNNVFSHDSAVDKMNGYNQEELKIINETKKILNSNELKITATCIRVPVFRSHCESVNVKFEDEILEENIRIALNDFSGINIIDDRINNNFPEPIKSENKNNILVGRIRKDYSDENSFNFFISGDQLRKGAALNALQIAENLKII